MKSFLLALCMATGIGVVMATATTPPAPPSPPLSERDKAMQRLAAKVTPRQIEDMKRTAKITGMEFKEVWGLTLAMVACSSEPVLCPPTETKTKKEKKQR
jgi:hypothetical protein